MKIAIVAQHATPCTRAPTQSPRRPGSSPTRAHSPRTSATPDPEARHVSAPAPVPSS
jgi:hypothetical protein